MSRRKPLLIIVNGLPGSGKTTLSRQLAADLQLPIFARDGLYETFYDALENNGCPTSIGPAMFTILYSLTGLVLAAGQPLIVEGFFGNTELRSAEFLQLQHVHDFEPFQILCKADGKVLLERFLARAKSVERHIGHRDLEWLAHNNGKDRLLKGYLVPLTLGGQVVEIDTTTPHSFDYANLLQRIQVALFNTRIH